MTHNFYRAFEEKFRGSRELIKSRLHVYLPFVKPLRDLMRPASAVDLGCGRGEWLELLAEEGFAAEGVELDEGMLAACLERHLTAHHQDAIEFMKALPNASQVVVSGFHIVEHIPFDDLQTLIAEALRVLKPGGLLILETPNPENLVVGTSSFYLDPTHQRPIPPQLLAFIPEFTGFKRTKILRLQESKELVESSAATLLQVLGGVSPDYAVIAQKDGSDKTIRAIDLAFNVEYGLQLHELADRYQTTTEALINEKENVAVAAEARAGEQESRALVAEARAQAQEERAVAAEARAGEQESRALVAETRAQAQEERAVAAEARAGEQESRALVAETRTQAQEERAVAAEARAGEQESRAVAAEARSQAQEERAVAAEARAGEQESRALVAETRAQAQEERAVAAEARAGEQESRAVAAEARSQAQEERAVAAEARAGEQESRALVAETRAQAQEERAVAAEARAGEQESRAVAAEARSQAQEERAVAAEARAGEQESRALVAETRAQAQEERAVAAEARAGEQESRAVAAEARSQAQEERAVAAEARAGEQEGRAMAAEARAQAQEERAVAAESRAGEQEGLAMAAEARAQAQEERAAAAETWGHNEQARALTAEAHAQELESQLKQIHQALTGTHTQLEAITRQAHDWHDQILCLQRSVSWRATSPLRFVRKLTVALLRGVKALLKVLVLSVAGLLSLPFLPLLLIAIPFVLARPALRNRLGQRIKHYPKLRYTLRLCAYKLGFIPYDQRLEGWRFQNQQLGLPAKTSLSSPSPIVEGNGETVPDQPTETPSSPPEIQTVPAEVSAVTQEIEHRPVESIATHSDLSHLTPRARQIYYQLLEARKK